MKPNMNTFQTTNFFHMKSIKNVYKFLFLIDGTMDHKALSFITYTLLAHNQIPFSLTCFLSPIL